MSFRPFSDAMMVGDGRWHGDSTQGGTYWTTSPQLADDFAEVALKCGYIVQQKSATGLAPAPSGVAPS